MNDDKIQQLTSDQCSAPETRELVLGFVLHHPNNKYVDALSRLSPILWEHITSSYTGKKNELLYKYVHDIGAPPVCVECGKKTKFVAFRLGYQRFCSKRCADVSDLPNKRRSTTNTQRYGASNFLATDQGKAKSKQTCIERYGVDNVGKSSDIQNKRKQTMNERYGVDYTNESPTLKSKYEQTMVDRYGVSHPSQNSLLYTKRNEAMKQKHGANHAMQCQHLKTKHSTTLYHNYGVLIPLQSPVIQTKFKETMVSRYGKKYTAQVDWLFDQMRKTNVERYGVEYPLQNEEVQQRYRETSLERYGVDYPIQNEEVQSKQKQTNVERYGVEYPLQNEEVQHRKRARMEEQGRWIPKHMWEDVRLYYSQVWKITNKQHLCRLENFDHRGLAGVDGAYHVDHKVSIKYGFENGIPPYIVGSIHNLIMLPWRDNVYKSSNCSIEPNLLIDVVLDFYPRHKYATHFFCRC